MLLFVKQTVKHNQIIVWPIFRPMKKVSGRFVYSPPVSIYQRLSLDSERSFAYN